MRAEYRKAAINANQRFKKFETRMTGIKYDSVRFRFTCDALHLKRWTAIRIREYMASRREQYLAFPATLGVEQDGIGAAQLFVHGFGWTQLGDTG